MKKTASISLFLILLTFFVSCKKDPIKPALRFPDGKGILSVGQTGLFYMKGDQNPIRLKFIKVTEDSRCPANARCIWAGEVVAEIEINKQGPFSVASAEATKPPLFVEGKHITITQVLPNRGTSDTQINQEDYQLEFSVSN